MLLGKMPCWSPPSAPEAKQARARAVGCGAVAVVDPCASGRMLTVSRGCTGCASACAPTHPPHSRPARPWGSGGEKDAFVPARGLGAASGPASTRRDEGEATCLGSSHGGGVRDGASGQIPPLTPGLFSSGHMVGSPGAAHSLFGVVTF